MHEIMFTSELTHVLFELVISLRNELFLIEMSYLATIDISYRAISIIFIMQMYHRVNHIVDAFNVMINYY